MYLLECRVYGAQGLEGISARIQEGGRGGSEFSEHFIVGYKRAKPP